MSRRPPSYALVAQAERELAPLAHTLTECALCGGARDAAFRHFAYLPSDARLPRVAYTLCGPCATGATAQDRQRLEQRFHADPAFCSHCFHGGHG